MALVAAAAATPHARWAQTGPKKVALYASVGSVLTQYDVDVDGLTLTARSSVTLPANVQYAWPHRSHGYLYSRGRPRARCTCTRTAESSTA